MIGNRHREHFHARSMLPFSCANYQLFGGAMGRPWDVKMHADTFFGCRWAAGASAKPPTYLELLPLLPVLAFTGEIITVYSV